MIAWCDVDKSGVRRAGFLPAGFTPMAAPRS